MQSLSRVVARNSAFGAAAQLAVKLLSFGFSVLVVRHLGPGAFGQYAAVLAFGAMFVFVGDLGLSLYVVREVARQRDTPDGSERVSTLYGSVLRLRLLLSLLAAVLLVTTGWLTGRPLVMLGALALGGLGLIIYSVQGTSEAVLAGFERLDLAAAAKVISQLVFVLAGAAALWWGAGYYGLIVANLLGAVIIAALCWRWVRWLGVRPRRAATRGWAALLRASLPFGVGGLALGLSYRFDSVLLNVFRGDAETGYYSAAYNLVFSAAFLSNALNAALYPSLARQATSAPEALPRVCERVLRYLMALALPIAVGAWALADRLVPFLFTDAYTPAVAALQIVIWVTPLMFASEFLGYVALVQDSERRAARAAIVSTGMNAALNLLLVPRFGLLAAAMTTVVTEAVLVGQYLWMLRGLVGQLDWSRMLLRPALAALAMGGVAFALRDLPLLVSAAAAAVAYGALLPTLGVLGTDELRFVRSLRVRPGAAATGGRAAATESRLVG